MNSYEIAILRMLVKRQVPIKVSDLISGFPDNSGGRVLHAISNLHSSGYVLVHGAPFDGYLLLTKDKRREAMKIISPSITNDNQVTGSSCSEQVVAPRVKNKTFTLLAIVGIAALSIMIISALSITLAGSPSSYPSSPYPSRYVSNGHSSPSPVYVFTSSDQYAGSTSLTEPKGPNAFVFISSSGTSEPTISPMVHRISTANTNSGPFYTIFLEIDNYTTQNQIPVVLLNKYESPPKIEM
jgi:hypothetical protein